MLYGLPESDAVVVEVLSRLDGHLAYISEPMAAGSETRHYRLS
jgi:hypothetical protein